MTGCLHRNGRAITCMWGGSHKTMREGWPQDARALKQQPAQPPPTSAAGYISTYHLPLLVYYYLLLHTSDESLLFSKETTMKRRSRETADKVVFSSVGKKSGSIYTFQKTFFCYWIEVASIFLFLSGKFFWFKYRTLVVLPYLFSVLLIFLIDSLIRCVCVCVWGYVTKMSRGSWDVRNGSAQNRHWLAEKINKGLKRRNVYITVFRCRLPEKLSSALYNVICVGNDK